MKKYTNGAIITNKSKSTVGYVTDIRFIGEECTFFMNYAGDKIRYAIKEVDDDLLVLGVDIPPMESVQLVDSAISIMIEEIRNDPPRQLSLSEIDYLSALLDANCRFRGFVPTRNREWIDNLLNVAHKIYTEGK